MASTQDLPALLAQAEGYEGLAEDGRERLMTMASHVEEVVGVEHLVKVLGGHPMR